MQTASISPQRRTEQLDERRRDVAGRRDDLRQALQLRADATDWQSFAEKARSAARDAVGRTHLDIRQLSKYAAELEGINRLLMVKYSTLLSAAAENFDGLAVALRSAADLYEAEQACHVHDIKQNW